MRKRTIIFALIAMASGATGTVVAAPNDQNQPEPSASPEADEVPAPMPPGRGRLGFAAIQISPGLRTFFGAPADRGVLVDQIRPDSPAARAGLRVGDVVVEVDADAVRSVGDVIDAISDRKTGDVVAIAIERGRQRMTLQAKLEDNLGPRPGPRIRGRDRSGDGGREQLDSDEVPPGKRQPGENMRRTLEDLRNQVEELERRLEKLER
jgi:membrane-associated protease RseP (regulator of RpoE activity)